MWTATRPFSSVPRLVAALTTKPAPSALPPKIQQRPASSLSPPAATARPRIQSRHPGARSSPSRAFTTTTVLPAKTIKPHRLPSDLIPPYPYGERLIYKQSNRGLYGSARIRFGNTIAEKHDNKSRRFWRPNVHVKAFFSPALGANIKTRLTLRVLKTIRREGGIDNYLLKNKPARIKELGPGGWNLRWILMQTQAVQHQLNQERVALGLPPKDIENRDDIIQFALDYATPGPLSARSRGTLEQMRGAAEGAFVLGHESSTGTEHVEELSDEAERQLLQEAGKDGRVA